MIRNVGSQLFDYKNTGINSNAPNTNVCRDLLKHILCLFEIESCVASEWFIIKYITPNGSGVETM